MCYRWHGKIKYNTIIYRLKYYNQNSLTYCFGYGSKFSIFYTHVKYKTISDEKNMPLKEITLMIPKKLLQLKI